MKKVLLSLCLFLSSCAAQRNSTPIGASSKAKIFGGVPAYRSADSAYGAILDIVTTTGRFTCTATPITSEFMLVSAHCLKKGLKNLKVLFFADQVTPGILNSWPASKTRTIKNYVIPPEYGMNLPPGQGNRYDIALLQLSSPMPKGMKSFTLSTQPLAADAPEVGLLGYGFEDVILKADGSEVSVGPEYFRFANQSILPTSQPGMILLDGHHGQGTCAGDSGGPVFVWHKAGYPLLVGLTTTRLTFRDQTDQCRVNSLAVEISQHLNWILQNIQRLSRTENQ